MKSYKMTVHLRTPAVFNTLNPLDANIAGMLFRGKIASDDEVDSRLRELFAFHDEGFAMASLPIMDATRPVVDVIAGNFDRHAHERLMFESKIAVDKLSGLATRYAAPTFIRDTLLVKWPTRTLVYYFTGDARKVKTVMETNCAIGARTGHGYGEIEGILIEEMDFDNCGICDPDGNLIRPIPHHLADEMGLRGMKIVRPYSVPYSPRMRDEKNLNVPISVIPHFASPVL